ncbi:MAG: UTRA domain-containing protein [Arenicella sp.]
MTANSHHTVRESIRQRIESGEWGLGALIPGEMALAEEYGCARTTINRALQTLADDGLVVRKRKGGTRVCQMPVHQAKFEIPIIREQVEAAGCRYRHQLITMKSKVPPSAILTRLQLPKGEKAVYMETIHLADDRPYAYEQRWVNLLAVPAITDAPLDEISANEWLLKTVPFSNGDVIFYAVNADKNVAEAIESDQGTAVFVIDRTTSFDDKVITTMKLYYREGYQLYSQL